MSHRTAMRPWPNPGRHRTSPRRASARRWQRCNRSSPEHAWDAAMSDVTRYELLWLVRLLHEKDRRLQAQRELLAIVSHDLRGPLSAILAGTQLILQSPD